MNGIMIIFNLIQHLLYNKERAERGEDPFCSFSLIKTHIIAGICLI